MLPANIDFAEIDQKSSEHIVLVQRLTEPKGIPMAEPILASLIHGIASLLTTGVADQGQRLLATGQDERWLRDELLGMQIFLHEMEACAGDGGAVTEALVHQIRDIMLDSEDAIDVFDAS